MLTKRVIFIAALLISVFALTAQDSITVEKIWGSYSYIEKRVPGFKFMKSGAHYSDSKAR